jgi:hypothetical protein
MSLVASTIIAQVRLLGSVPNQNQGRWSDTNLLVFIDMAQKYLVQELLFPECRLITTTVANTQYYTLPETHRLYRVYIDSQIIVPVPGGIDTLEGTQIGMYDQTGSGPVSSDAPQGGATASPQWATITPTAYPYIANYGAPAPATQPAFIGSVPRYYRRGGGIGFVPEPLNAATLTVDGVFTPPTITSSTQILLVPSYYQDALTWYSIVLMKFADDTQANQDQRNFAEGQFRERLKNLRTTVRAYSLENDRSLVRTDRYKYAFGRNTVANGSQSI